MKSIIKMVVAVAFLVAAFNAGRAQLANYRFEDAVHEGLLFNPRATESEAQDMVMKAAAENDVPIETSGITLTKNGLDIRIDMKYTKKIVLIPGVYSKDWEFTPSASTRFLPGAGR